jgi:hypothetical protein
VAIGYLLRLGCHVGGPGRLLVQGRLNPEKIDDFGG